MQWINFFVWFLTKCCASFSSDGIEKLIGEEADTATEKVEFENHEVFVNTEMDLGDSGFLLSTNEETVRKITSMSFFQAEITYLLSF